MLSINFLPNAIYKPETCIRATLEAAKELGFPTHRIMFEVTEGERVSDHAHLTQCCSLKRVHPEPVEGCMGFDKLSPNG